MPWWALAYANERALDAAYHVLGCVPPTYEPRRHGHMPEMVELMHELVDQGHAYPAADGSGDVYFDVRSWPDYGELSNQRVDDMEPAADADPRGKRDPRDFALWKGPKDGEPVTASWPTPYGRAVPAGTSSARRWRQVPRPRVRHPRRRDSTCASRTTRTSWPSRPRPGQPFARWWMHNALLNLGGAKMSKSVGNTMLVSEVVKRVRPVELRYYLVAPTTARSIEYSDEALTEAAAAYQRMESFVLRATELMGGVVRRGAPCADFVEAMDDDLAVPAALAALSGRVREGNKLLAAGPRTRCRGAEPPFGRCSMCSGSTRCRSTGPARAARVTCTRVVDRWWPSPWPSRAPRRARARTTRRRPDPRRARRGRGRRRGHTERPTLGDRSAKGPDGRQHPAQGREAQGRIEEGPWSSDPAASAAAASRARARRPRPSSGRATQRAAPRAGPGGGAGPADADPAADRTRSPRAPPRWVAGRNAVVEALRAQVPVKALYVAERIDVDDRVREVIKIASTAASRCWRPRAPSSTGSPVAPSTRVWR